MRKLTAIAILVLAAAAVYAQSSGGTFSVISSVVGGGGGTSAAGTFSVTGTAAQPGADDNMSGSTFSMRSGYWQPSVFAPTAAGASISGRVTTPGGMGLRNAVITLTGASLTQPLIARTGAFGYFTFTDVEVGHSYILSVSSKRYGFGQATQFFTLLDSLTDVVFQASWEN